MINKKLNINYQKSIDLGKTGENLVINYLKNLNYNIISCNFSHKKNIGEIDIIAKKEDILAFVEVKTRSSNFININDIVSFRKKNSIIKTAEFFLFKNNIHSSTYSIRFDIAYINNFNIEYFENAFAKI